MRFHGPEFANDGGPLIVLPRTSASAWAGTPDGSVAGDYGRACDVDEIVGSVPVGNALGIVVGSCEHVATAQWLVAGSDEACVVGWFYGDEDSEPALLRAYPRLASDVWQPVAEGVPVSGDLLLLHAGDSGTETAVWSPGEAVDFVGIGDAVPANVSSGAYDVSWRIEKLAEIAQCVLCRWRRSA